MCSNCEECVYNRMCGSKEKYKQMIDEYNELNKKWDIFESNPKCPEFKDIEKFAEENGYSKCTSRIEDYNKTMTIKAKPIEECSKEDLFCEYEPPFKYSFLCGLEEESKKETSDKEKYNELFYKLIEHICNEY